MIPERKNSIFGWLILVLIGVSITFSTLHSHHHLELDHTESQVDTGHCLVENTNTCPICGYLFNANIADRQTQSPLTAVKNQVTILSESQQIDPFTGQLTGRAPPFIG